MEDSGAVLRGEHALRNPSPVANQLVVAGILIQILIYVMIDAVDVSGFLSPRSVL